MRPGPHDLSIDLLDAAVELMGRSGRLGQVRVKGRSMVPTLLEGQTLAVDFAPGRLRRGDIILFRLDGQLVVHRLVGKARRRGVQHLRARGDGRIYFDPRVPPEQVVGRVVALLDDRGWWSVRGRPARIYGRCLAGHDFFWGAAGVLARLGEGGLGRVGLRVHLLARVRNLDRWLLRHTHRLLFDRVHRPIGAPDAAGPF